MLDWDDPLGLHKPPAATEAGMAIDTACRQITFAYAVDPDVFLTIAKLGVMQS